MVKTSNHPHGHRDWEETLREIPYLRLTLAFLGGIVWQCSAWFFHFPTWPLTLALCGLFLLTLFIPYCRRYGRQWTGGLIMLLFLFSAGTTVVQNQQTESRLPLNQTIHVKAIVSEKADAGTRYLKTPVVIHAYADSNGTHALREKTTLYLEADSTQIIPLPGDTIIAAVRLSEIPAPQNPDEFDYQAYMKRRYIFTTGFVQPLHYLLMPAQVKNIRHIPAQLRENTHQIFVYKKLSGDELAVLSALTLGDKRDIDDELRQSYASSGATHILAVSGLHVGIIFAILSIALSFLGKKRRGSVTKNIPIIGFLWFYAAMVGFSPSVNRATVMFTFVLAGQMMQRRISIYNSLAASAFFICLFKPFEIFNIGFQLSYCAVISIVYFQPLISRLIYVRNKILNYIWQLLTVSLAAQIGTIPLTLMSFHQFPNYFLMTNLCVIPLTGIIVYLSAILVSLSWIPVISDIMARCLEISLWLLNYIVRFIEELPYSTIANIFIGKPQVWILFLLIIAVMLAIELKSRKIVWISMYLLVGFFACGAWQSIQQQQQQFIAVYNVRRASYLHFVHGRNAVSLRDSSTINQSFDFNLNAFFITRGIAGKPSINIPIHKSANDTVIQNLQIYRNFIIFGNKLIKVLNEAPIETAQPMPVNYLVVTSASQHYPKQALALYQPKQVVLDASLPAYRCRQWEAAAHEQNIALHNVKQQGAWIEKIN